MRENRPRLVSYLGVTALEGQVAILPVKPLGFDGTVAATAFFLMICPKVQIVMAPFGDHPDPVTALKTLIEKIIGDVSVTSQIFSSRDVQGWVLEVERKEVAGQSFEKTVVEALGDVPLSVRDLVLLGRMISRTRISDNVKEILRLWTISIQQVGRELRRGSTADDFFKTVTKRLEDLAAKD